MKNNTQFLVKNSFGTKNYFASYKHEFVSTISVTNFECIIVLFRTNLQNYQIRINHSTGKSFLTNRLLHLSTYHGVLTSLSPPLYLILLARKLKVGTKTRFSQKNV